MAPFSGFTIQRTKTGAVNLNTNWFSDFSLPDETPDELLIFLHLSVGLSETAIVNVIRNGIAYSLNNNGNNNL